MDLIAGSKTSENQRLVLNNLVISVLTTSVLMWSYGLHTLFYVDDFFYIKSLSLIYPLLHLLSPLVYIIYPSVGICTYLFITIGFLFQLHYCFATEGLHSSVCIWFSILPMLAGVLLGLRHAIIWGLVAIFGVVLLFIKEIVQHGSIEHYGLGVMWTDFNIKIGYIILNTLLISAYVFNKDKQNQNIENKNEQIKSLIRILSHDINNSLASIKLGSSYLLKKGELNNAGVTILESHLKAVTKISEIVEHTRNIEALETGKIKLDIKKIILVDVIKSCADTFMFSLQEKNIDLYLKLPDDDLYIDADSVVLENQVFNNILSNAIKFSPKDSTIEINTAVDGSNISVAFKDYGVGIPQDKLPAIFENYSKTTTSGTDGEVGTGFELPIVKSIMDALSASIKVESFCSVSKTDESGTKFILTFALSTT